MEKIINWFTAGGFESILLMLGALILFGSILSGLTKTPKDDAFFNRVKEILNRFGLLRFKDEPGTFKMPGQGPTKTVVKTIEPAKPIE